MVRVFREADAAQGDAGVWSFSYVDWQGRTQIGAGTESRAETERLADLVQREHVLLRRHRRHPGDDGGGERPTAHAASTDAASNGAATPEATRPEDAGRIGTMLVEAGVLAAEHRDAALAHQAVHGGRLVEIAIEKGYMTPSDYVRFMSGKPGNPFIDIENCLLIPAAVLQLVPRPLAARLEAIPIDRMGKMLSVAMVCPLDKAAVATLHRETGLQVRPLLCSHAGFRIALARHYGNPAEPAAGAFRRPGRM